MSQEDGKEEILHAKVSYVGVVLELCWSKSVSFDEAIWLNPQTLAPKS